MPAFSRPAGKSSFFQAGTLGLMLLTTTSVYDSGLLDRVIPEFEKIHNCAVKVLAVGSGAAFRIAGDGNCDIIFVHDREGEEKFLEGGAGAGRYPVMRNEFVIAGPRRDPAGAGGAGSVFEAFEAVSRAGAPFVSRGDNSGTHKKEMEIWKSAGAPPSGKRYLRTGNGMIETLRIAEELNAYVLTDISTFTSHRDEFANIALLFADSANLINEYSLIPVSAEKFKWVHYSLAMEFVRFMLDGGGKEIIKNHKAGGKPLFHLPAGE